MAERRRSWFSGAELVVDADDFKFDASRVLLLNSSAKELEALELVGSHAAIKPERGQAKQF